MVIVAILINIGTVRSQTANGDETFLKDLKRVATAVGAGTVPNIQTAYVKNGCNVVFTNKDNKKCTVLLMGDPKSPIVISVTAEGSSQTVWKPTGEIVSTGKWNDKNSFDSEMDAKGNPAGTSKETLAESKKIISELAKMLDVKPKKAKKK